MTGVIAFVGPSLHGTPAPAGCTLWPPAARGDVLRALAFGPRTLVLVDGYFHRVPAVTHQELLYALDAGVPVVGAASMGALRAAELERFGMRGVGRVFAAYRAGELDGDDEVALLHAPAAYGYAPVGLALVEVRAALEELVRGGVCPRAAAADLVGDLKRVSFERRTPALLAERAAVRLGPRANAALDERLRAVSVKRDDALLALAEGAAAARAGDAANGPRPGRRAATGYLTCFKELALPAPGVADATKPTLVEALFAALTLHPDAARLVAWSRRRAQRAAAARCAGAAVADADLVREARSLERRLPTSGARLPWPEILVEARTAALAAHAGAAAGAELLARRFGCGGEVELAAVCEAQPDLVPLWDLARAFAWSPALAAAVRTAAAAREVLACWRRAHGDARIDRAALFAFAAELWGCRPAEVAAAAERRGLFAAAGLGDGAREALELVAAAERLPRAINDYPERRSELRAARLLPLEGG